MDDAIAQFSGITSATADEARQFIEASNGDLELALSAYYENQGTAASDEGYSGPRTLSGERAELLPEGWGGSAGGLGSASASGRSTPSGGVRNSSGSRIGRVGQWGSESGGGSSNASGGRKIATLRDLKSGGPAAPHGHPHGDDDDSDDEEGPQDLYAGGERSGLSVQGPPRAGQGAPNTVVSDILRKAAEGGRAPPSSGPSRSTGPSVFGGAGNRLGSEDDSPAPAAVPPTSAAAPLPGSFPGAQPEEEEEEEEEVAVRNLTFWRDGFSIEDGPLMKYEEHQETLAALNAGRAPLSLLSVRFGQPVSLQVAQRTTEDYRSPPKVFKAFSGGGGQRLGSPSPAVVSSAATAPVAPAAPADAGAGAGTGRGTEGQVKFEVDEGKPTAQVQVRLGDGSRMVARVNLTHTILDLRGLIEASRPGAADRPYVLQTTFPNRELTDLDQTVADAKLAGGVVVVKFV